MTESTLDNFLETISIKDKSMSQPLPWGIKDFNNVETADRKLIINNKLELWVHDGALSAYSTYFENIFKSNLNKADDISTDINTISQSNEGDVIITKIEVPHEEYIFDIILWIYTKDAKKIKKVSKNFKNFINLISLAIFLKMKEEFFDILLNELKIEFHGDDFENPLWSRKVFTFPILAKIVYKMNANDLTKIIALLSWLKYPKDQKDTNLCNEILCSQDLFYVRNLIQKTNLMMNIPINDIFFLKREFPGLTSAFDSVGIIKNLIFCHPLTCIICHKQFHSQFDILNNKSCISNDNAKYHPPCINNKQPCLHHECRRKFYKGEYPCCHKKIDSSSGCLTGEGKHIFIFQK